MTRSRRILVISHDVETSGASRGLEVLLTHLDRTRFEPELACPAGSRLGAVAAAAGIPVHRVPMRVHQPFRRAASLWRTATAVVGILRRSHIDLVHAEAGVAGCAALLAGRRAGARVVWHVHDCRLDPSLRRACRRADAVLAGSSIAAAALGTFDGLRVVADGVPAEFLAIGAAERRAGRIAVGLAESTPMLLDVGHLAADKGQRTAIAAMPRILAAVPEAVLLLAGAARRSDGDARELERIAAGLGVADRVRLLGHRDDLAGLLAAADVVLEPTTSPHSCGRAAIEAKAAGRPMVAAAVGALRAIVRDGVDGWLAPPDDPGAFADRVIRLLQDPLLAARMGRAARTDARARFDARRAATEIAAVYDELLAAPAVA